jgi:deazaflavin-dependent oxidoreductase (nitroreductase family)
VSVLVSLLAAAAVVLAILVLAGGYRVLKTAHRRPAHTRPGQLPGRPHPGSHSNSGLERIVLKSVGGTITLLVRLGIPVGPVRLLTVRGRTTGLPRTNPVDLFLQDGGYWLIATHSADASWIRNLRAAGEGTLDRGRRRLAFTAAELPQDEAGTALLRIAGPRLARPLGGLVLRQTLGLTADASPAEFDRAAAGHPVFRLTIRGSTQDLDAPGHAAPVAAADGGIRHGGPVRSRSSKAAVAAVAAIGLGGLLAAVHLFLGATGLVTWPEWIGGLAFGLIVAGAGNHLRIFGRR